MLVTSMSLVLSAHNILCPVMADQGLPVPPVLQLLLPLMIQKRSMASSEAQHNCDEQLRLIRHGCD